MRNIVLTNDWTSFWNAIGDWFGKIWNNLYYFWINPSANPDATGNESPYLATFLFAFGILVIGIFLIKLINIVLRKILKLGKRKFVKDRTIKNFIANTIKVLLYVFLFFLFLSILGVNLSGLATIFSSAILAVGLCLQDVIGNFASGIVILASKPFQVDDYVSFPDAKVEGTVVDVKFLSIILKTVDGQKIVIPNQNVTKNSIINYSAYPVRRLVVNCGVQYGEDVGKVKRVLLAIAKKDKRTLKDPEPYAVLTSFADSSVVISLRMYVPNDLYWDMLFQINEIIYKEFNANNISFAFNHLDICDVTGKKIDLNTVVVPKKYEGHISHDGESDGD